jgi:acyl-CoA thioesterase I
MIGSITAFAKPRRGHAARALGAWLFSIGLALFYLNPARAATILIYGDSLSAGYGLASGQSWPSLLAERLSREAPQYQLVNASISGETSAGGASRIAAELARTHPAVVVLELGANDGLRGLALAQMKANLERIIRACRAQRARVLLVGMQLPPNYGLPYTQAFAATFPELAKATGSALMPFLLEGVADQRALFQADGLHPNATAQPMILDKLWPHLRPLL